MLKRFLLLTCLIAAFTATRTQAQLSCIECEPGAVIEGEACGLSSNDECFSAVPISCGQTICGTLFTDGMTNAHDVDWYVFELTETAYVTVNFNFKSNAMISLYNNCFDLPLNFGFAASCEEGTFSGNLQPGVYYVEIMPVFDALECVDEPFYNFSIECGEPAECDIDVIVGTETSCPGSGTGGGVFAIVIGGQGPFNYFWSTGDMDESIYGLEDGTYAVTVVDQNGCADTASAALSSTCPPVGLVWVSGVHFNKATVEWMSNECAQKYRVQIRPQGTTTWTTYFVNAPNTSRLIKNLQPGTTYQYRVRTQCSSNGQFISPWSATQSFTTPGGCGSPSGIGITPSSDEAFVSWTAGSGAVKYRLRYRVQGTTTWTPKVINGAFTTYTIMDLMPNTTYELQMRSQCDAQGTDFSPFTPIQTFTTMMRLGESDAAALAVYPNPNSGAFTISLTSTTAETVRVSVYDMLGRAVSVSDIEVRTGINNVPFGLELAAGQYIVKVEGNAVNNVLRFTVQ